jgi:aminopeptidase N
MAHDSDGFNRYESAARFASRCVLDMATKLAAGPAADDVYPAFDAAFLDAWGSLFDSADAFLESGTCHLLAMMLRLPADVEVLNMMSVYDAEAVKKAKRALMRALASQRASALLPLYRRVRVNPKASYELTAAHEGRRALAAVLLGYAAALGTEETSQAVAAHYNEASNMTDASAALEIIASTDCKQRQGILDDFEAQWRSHREVIDTWFTVQATSSLPNAEARLRELMRHETFSLSNPNKVRAVVGVLATMAPHVLFQSGVLKLLGEVICTVDATNGHLAASLCKLLQVWRKLPEPLRSEAKAVLEKVSSRGGCSKNAGEVCVTALRD